VQHPAADQETMIFMAQVCGNGNSGCTAVMQDASYLVYVGFSGMDDWIGIDKVHVAAASC
jgi:hypothetical protein